MSHALVTVGLDRYNQRKRKFRHEIIERPKKRTRHNDE
jgi:hypothetical protein